jgi:hypothetical protein
MSLYPLFIFAEETLNSRMTEALARQAIANEAITKRNSVFIQKIVLNEKPFTEETLLRLIAVNSMTITPSFKGGVKDLQVLLEKFGRQIEYLDLQSVQWVNQEILTLLAFYCSNLKTLYLDFTKITDLSVLTGKCSQLLTLSLIGCSQLDEASLQGFLKESPQLQHIGLSNCKQIDDSIVQAIALHCPQIRVLRLNRCSKVSDTSIQAIAEHSPLLQQLWLCKCTQITDASIRNIIQCCSRLQVLMLSGSKVTLPIKQMVAQKYEPYKLSMR